MRTSKLYDKITLSGDVFQIELTREGEMFLGNNRLRLDNIAQLIPPFYEIIDAFKEINNPAIYGSVLFVKVKPYTEEQKYRECLDYFIDNLSVYSQPDASEIKKIQTIQTQCGELQLRVDYLQREVSRLDRRKANR
jgi:hypothetical protein